MNSYLDDGGVYAGGSGYNPKDTEPAPKLGRCRRILNFIINKLKRNKK